MTLIDSLQDLQDSAIDCHAVSVPAGLVPVAFGEKGLDLQAPAELDERSPRDTLGGGYAARGRAKIK
jgi:hypothetical protein